MFQVTFPPVTTSQMVITSSTKRAFFTSRKLELLGVPGWYGKVRCLNTQHTCEKSDVDLVHLRRSFASVWIVFTEVL